MIQIRCPRWIFHNYSILRDGVLLQHAPNGSRLLEFSNSTSSAASFATGAAVHGLASTVHPSDRCSFWGRGLRNRFYTLQLMDREDRETALIRIQSNWINVVPMTGAEESIKNPRFLSKAFFSQNGGYVAWVISTWPDGDFQCRPRIIVETSEATKSRRVPVGAEGISIGISGDGANWRLTGRTGPLCPKA